MLHRALGAMQARRDRPVAQAAADEIEDGALARRQAERIIATVRVRPARDVARAVRAEAPAHDARGRHGAERAEDGVRLAQRRLVAALQGEGLLVRAGEVGPGARRAAKVAGELQRAHGEATWPSRSAGTA